MGTAEDMAFRNNHRRLDSVERQESILLAREVIELGNAVSGDPVLKHLTHSGVPTIVRAISPHYLVHDLIFHHRIRSLSACS